MPEVPHYDCPFCEDTFLSLIKRSEHLSWHEEQNKKRASKVKKPSATEEMGLTHEPTAEEITKKKGPLPFDRPRLSDVIGQITPQAASTDVPSPQVDAKPLPIELNYKYSGQCPTCHSQVTTIEVGLEEKNAVTAFCVPCNKTLQQKLVVPISKQ